MLHVLIIIIPASKFILFFNWRNNIKKELSFLWATTEQSWSQLSLTTFCLWAESNRLLPLNELCLADRRPTRHALQWLSPPAAPTCPSVSSFLALPISTFNNANCQLYMQSAQGLQQIVLHASFLISGSHTKNPAWPETMDDGKGRWALDPTNNPTAAVGNTLSSSSSYLFSLYCEPFRYSFGKFYLHK